MNNKCVLLYFCVLFFTYSRCDLGVRVLLTIWSGFFDDTAVYSPIDSLWFWWQVLVICIWVGILGSSVFLTTNYTPLVRCSLLSSSNHLRFNNNPASIHIRMTSLLCRSILNITNLFMARLLQEHIKSLNNLIGLSIKPIKSLNHISIIDPPHHEFHHQPTMPLVWCLHLWRRVIWSFLCVPPIYWL